MKLKTAIQKIKDIPDGEFFHVTFLKRSTGEERSMTCRKGVTKFQGSGVRAYEPDKHNLMFVWDAGLFASKRTNWRLVNPTTTQAEVALAEIEIGKQCFRSINLELLMTLKIKGVEYTVNELPLQSYTIRWTAKGTSSERVVDARTPEEAMLVFKRQLRLTRMPAGASVVLND